jgi:acyl-coenzyme A synthetase/AMP-(fatty) acid ligase
VHIVDVIYHWARAKPHQPAIIQPDTIITYRGLADAITFITQRLATLKLDPKRPVGVSIEHPAKQLAVCLALAHAGYVAAPVYRGLLPYLASIGIEDLIYEAEGNVLSGGRNIRFDASWLPSGPVPLPSAGAAAPAPSPDMIFFTSGTTGTPKKIVQTEAALLARMNLTPLLGLPSFTRTLILPGLATNFGFNHVCAALRDGKTACFALPGVGRLVLISTYGIEQLIASPAQVLALADVADANPGYALGALHTIWLSGAFASRDVIKRIQSSLCRNIIVGYASTEAAQVAMAPHAMIAHIPDAVGFVGPWAQVEIVDEAQRVLPAQSEGYLRFRTPFYLANFAANNPGADSRDAWYYPGDLGYVTENGVLCIRGRGDDVINSGGLKISAGSIEEVALACAGVRDAGVCSVKGESGLEEVWIGLVTTPAFTLAEFQRALERHPRINELLVSLGAEVVSVDAIPRNELGKIQRQALRDKLRSVQKGEPRS